MRTLIKCILCLCVGYVLGTPSSQAAPAPATPGEQKTSTATPSEKTPESSAERSKITVTDVALSGKEGILLGQVVDPTGGAVAGLPVSLRGNNRVLAKGRSDSQGYFAFRHLRGGVYQVVSAKGFITVRAWAAGTAPKSAQSKMLLVVGDAAVRAQQTPPSGKRGGCVRRWLRNPVVVAGIVTAAVAVPLSVSGSNKDDNGAVTAVPGPSPAITQVPASQ